MTDTSKPQDKKPRKTLTDEDIVEQPAIRRSAIERLGLAVETSVLKPEQHEGEPNDADGS